MTNPEIHRIDIPPVESITARPRLSKVLIGSVAALSLVLAAAVGIVAYYMTTGPRGLSDEAPPIVQPSVFEAGGQT